MNNLRQIKLKIIHILCHAIKKVNMAVEFVLQLRNVTTHKEKKEISILSCCLHGTRTEIESLYGMNTSTTCTLYMSCLVFQRTDAIHQEGIQELTQVRDIIYGEPEGHYREGGVL